MKADFSKEMNRMLWADFREAYRGYSTQAFIIWCFLKCCLDRNLCEQTKEGYENLSNIKSDFYNRKIDAGKIEILFNGVDKQYKQERMCSRFAAFFKEGINYQENIINVISRFDFSNESEEAIELVKSGIYFLQTSVAGRYVAETTNQGISRIASEILKVTDNDIYGDFCSGIGLSTLEIVNNKKTRISVSDINPDARSLSFMLFVMNNFANFDISDFQEEKERYVTKLFSDLPVIPVGENEKISASTKYHADFLIKAKNMIARGGKAILVVPGKYLFSSMDAIRYSRDVLIIEKYLDSVIALPFTFEGTSLTANLIILDKNPNKTTLFVDASRFNASTKDIDRIVEIYEKRLEINGVSKLVDSEEIMHQGTSFVPARYTIEVVARDIDKELEETQRKLDLALEHLNALLKK